MKKYLISLIMLTPSLLFSQDILYLSGGITYSSFISDPGARFLPGFTFGFGHEQDISKDWSFSLGIYYSKEGGILENKIIKSVSELDTIYSYIDINFSAGYLRIPLNIEYSLQSSLNSKFGVFSGFSLLVTLNEYTHKEYKNLIQNNTNYDFTSLGKQESEFGLGNNSNISFDIGMRYSYKKLLFGGELNYQLFNFGTFDNLSDIDKNLLTFRLLIGVIL